MGVCSTVPSSCMCTNSVYVWGFNALYNPEWILLDTSTWFVAETTWWVLARYISIILMFEQRKIASCNNVFTCLSAWLWFSYSNWLASAGCEQQAIPIQHAAASWMDFIIRSLWRESTEGSKLWMNITGVTTVVPCFHTPPHTCTQDWIEMAM